MPFAELLEMIVRTLPYYVLRADLLMIVGVVLFLAYGQYQRIANMEARLFGFVQNPPRTQLAQAVLYGLLGGALATVAFVVLGVALNQVGIWYLWALAALLMFFHPRFLCFAYGGGALALSHLLFGFPEVDVAALMALIALLHLVEAALIFVSGGESATAVYARARDGGLVGGFHLAKVWPLPFVALVGAAVPPEVLEQAAGIDMPEWWPILRPAAAAAGEGYAFSFFPVIAALGYSDISLTALPHVKARRTALRLVVYSFALLALAVLSQDAKPFAFAAALFSPLAHEWVIRSTRRAEINGTPRFTGHETMTLAVHPDSPAARAGIRPGDVIKAVNGIPVATRADLAQAMEPWALSAVIDVENPLTGEERSVAVREKIPPLGLALVPRGDERVFVEVTTEPRWRRWWRRQTARWTLPK